MKTDKTRRDEIEEQCLKFHQRHPQVWKLFIQYAFDRIDRGFEHYSAVAIFQRIRWETDQAIVNPKQSFKLNNNYIPIYARRFMYRFPEHEGFFRTRRQISQDQPATDLPELNPTDYYYERAQNRL